ncbi:hypothetical protein [Solimicrobium silvestre]|uniref:Uncharacterized protein n=1 Tax=Solimicrobium silvestre TaxID=2099400 RepID=A0A2S9GYF1_9BURK|nr:hypothetical protein [Solimicrobium silvestre]PRC92686.1 hypothetical protein S2091_2741 [Solimicrobium silvestre]
MQKQIDAINERLDAGQGKFGEVADALSKITAHLQSQDAAMSLMADKVNQNAEGTQSILEMWNGGVKTVRFFCRLAEGWRFFIREMLIPVFLPLMGIGVVIYYFNHGDFPKWAAALFKLIA